MNKMLKIVSAMIVLLVLTSFLDRDTSTIKHEYNQIKCDSAEVVFRINSIDLKIKELERK